MPESGPPVTYPADGEFLEAASLDAWTAVYGRAASCVAAAIGRGTP